MGLDIYFHKTKRTEWKRFQNDLAAYENLPKDEQTDGNNPYRDFDPEEIGYFRKVNFLMSFFNYEDNCEYKEISKDKLEELRYACIEICRMKPVRVEVTKYTFGCTVEVKDYSLADQERCAELLPTQSGFFFGNTDYDQGYFNSVKEVLSWVDGVLDNLDDKKEVVLMYCWW